MKIKVTSGLENLIQNPPGFLAGKRLGLLSNPASVNSGFQPAFKCIDTFFPGQLRALFSPQHGFFAEKQDNMIESDHFQDGETGLPVFSLYSHARRPSKKMFDLIDVLLVDLQDAGTRVYTFVYTISYCLEAAVKFNKSIVILDRPNPIGGVEVEGNVLKKACSSFVGRYPIPMRHGLTMGELSMMFNTMGDIGCDLKVIPMKGWRRKMIYSQTGLPWVAPSPNLPTPASAMVYPGQVIFEGTNISEGRGTTQPFEFFGAPFLDQEKLMRDTEGRLPGALLRPVCFQPMFGKWQNQVCRGFQIHVVDHEQFMPYRTSLILLQSLVVNHGSRFEWKSPPYEYEFKRLPIDLILGSSRLRRRIMGKTPVEVIEKSWENELDDFKAYRQRFFLYD